MTLTCANAGWNLNPTSGCCVLHSLYELMCQQLATYSVFYLYGTPHAPVLHGSCKLIAYHVETT